MKALVSLVLSAALATGCSSGNIGYDTEADPFAQLARAKVQARAERKLILVVAGGDWCSGCHHLHDFLEEDRATQDRLDRAFVQVHVYVGEDNYNQDFFDTLPDCDYVPHYWILSADGAVLGEQDPEDLEFEDRDDYDPKRFARFIDSWKAGPPA